jgi:hypothetical protein
VDCALGVGARKVEEQSTRTQLNNSEWTAACSSAGNGPQTRRENCRSVRTAGPPRAPSWRPFHQSRVIQQIGRGSSMRGQVVLVSSSRRRAGARKRECAASRQCRLLCRNRLALQPCRWLGARELGSCARAGQRQHATGSGDAQRRRLKAAATTMTKNSRNDVCVGGVPVQVGRHRMRLSWIQQKLINPTY